MKEKILFILIKNNMSGLKTLLYVFLISFLTANAFFFLYRLNEKGFTCYASDLGNNYYQCVLDGKTITLQEVFNDLTRPR